MLGNDVIINEIMYHHAPQAVPGAVPASDGEEWIELYNRGSATVDLAGWELVDAVAYTIPAGIALPAGGYLVVARKSAKLRALYPAMAIIGDFVGRLDNTSGNIVLRNACGNPVDSVRYFDGGRWPSRPDVGGSSLELRDPSADNSAAEAWAASDESAAAVWQTFSYQGELFASGDLQKLVGPPARRRAFYGHLLDIIRTSYNEAYMGRWCQHYGALLSGQDFTGYCQFIADRSRWALEGAPDSLALALPEVPFGITTNGGADLEVTTADILLEGNGWLDVHEILRDGDAVSTGITWTGLSTWLANFPLACGTNLIALQAFDSRGAPVGSDSITVTRTGDVCP